MSALVTARRLWKQIAPLSVRAAAAPLVRPAARAYQRMAARRLWSDAPGHGPIRLVGLFDGSHGIARGARLAVRAFEALGAPVEQIGISFTEPDSARRIAEDPSAAAWIFHLNPPELVGALAMIGQPLHGPRYGYWAYELPRAPRAWLREAELVSEIWAPSRYTAEAMAGAAKPVRVVPHPLFIEDYAAIRPRPRAAGFVAITLCDLNSSEARKNPRGAIEAFRRAFGDDPGARLIVKTQHGQAHPDALARLRAAAGPNVEVMDATLPYPEVMSLIASADVLMSLHRAEGFGLTPAEAMAMGVPVIATGWSGNLDFMDDACALLIASRQTPVHDPQRVYAGQTWADPDLDAAAEALRSLRSRADLKRRLAVAGRARVIERLSPQAWFETLPDGVKAAAHQAAAAA